MFQSKNVHFITSTICINIQLVSIYITTPSLFLILTPVTNGTITQLSEIAAIQIVAMIFLALPGVEIY